MTEQAAHARPTPSTLAGIAADAATEAAVHVRRHVGRASPLRTKSSATDVVTPTDVEAETIIRRHLEARAPGSAVLGEEQGDRTGTSGVGWIIDPIDGTVNFLYDLPVVAVSIAATLSGRVVAGAVVDVLRQECFTASATAGAVRDGMSLRVNTPPSLSQSLVATGFSYDARRRGQQGRVLQRVVGATRDVRCFGSAALHLCWVACGRLDGYWETDLEPWDVAAGGLIAAEAGAEVRTPLLGAGPLTLAAPPEIFDALRALVAPSGRAESDGAPG